MKKMSLEMQGYTNWE